MDKYIDLLRNIVKNFDNEFDDIIKKILNKQICLFPPCLNKIIGSDNYCHLHNEKSI